MKFVFVFIFTLFNFTACSDKQLISRIEQGTIAMSGNKPPRFYKIANVQTMKDYQFNMKDYTISPPLATMKDFTLLGGWKGAIHYEKDFTIYLNAPLSYHISVSSSIGKYTEEDKQLELANNEFFKKKYKKRVYDFGHGHKETSRINVHLKHFGKENYPCFVSEIRDETINKFGEKTVKYKIFYRCYKFNSSRTKSKSVIITLTYTKNPNLPAKYKTLAKEYTYADLKRRARRMLDSLYIKDGW